jgi:hypothetical protein
VLPVAEDYQPPEETGVPLTLGGSRHPAPLCSSETGGSLILLRNQIKVLLVVARRNLMGHCCAFSKGLPRWEREARGSSSES